MNQEKISKDSQEKMMELQFLEQQAKQIEQQAHTIQTNISELNALKDALSDLSKVKKGESIFVPLGSGFFVNADMAENQEVLMNVGSKTLIKKSYPDADKLIDKQMKELEKTLPQFENEMSKLSLKAQSIQQELQKLQKE